MTHWKHWHTLCMYYSHTKHSNLMTHRKHWHSVINTLTLKILIHTVSRNTLTVNTQQQTLSYLFRIVLFHNIVATIDVRQNVSENVVVNAFYLHQTCHTLLHSWWEHGLKVWWHSRQYCSVALEGVGSRHNGCVGKFLTAKQTLQAAGERVQVLMTPRHCRFHGGHFEGGKMWVCLLASEKLGLVRLPSVITFWWHTGQGYFLVTSRKHGV